LKMNALKFLVILSLLLTVVAGRSRRGCSDWGIAMGCHEKFKQDAGISRVRKEEWRGIPATFQDQDEGDIPDDSNNAWNAMDLEMKNRKRASGYKGFKAYLEDFDQ